MSHEMTNTHQFDANTHINDLTHANSTVIHSLLAVHFSQSALTELYISANQHSLSYTFQPISTTSPHNHDVQSFADDIISLN